VAASPVLTVFQSDRAGQRAHVLARCARRTSIAFWAVFGSNCWAMAAGISDGGDGGYGYVEVENPEVLMCWADYSGPWPRICFRSTWLAVTWSETSPPFPR
jgi:hypothetical protein